MLRRDPTERPTTSRRAAPRGLVCLALLALCVSCSPGPPWENEDPKEALRGFLASMRLSQTQATWEYLNAEDRALLESRAAEIAERSDGALSPEPHSLLRPGHIVASSDEIASIEPVDGEGGEDAVTMRVTLHDTVRPEPLRTFTIAMERVDGRWTVDLPLENPGSHP